MIVVVAEICSVVLKVGELAVGVVTPSVV